MKESNELNSMQKCNAKSINNKNRKEERKTANEFKNLRFKDTMNV